MTCAHGVKREIEDGNNREILNQMCSESDTQCCVGSQGCEKYATDRGNQPVKLWAYDLIEDIAIFRACRSRTPIAGRVGPSLSIDDLDILPSSPANSPVYVFSVAYSGDNSTWVGKEYTYKSKDEATNNKAKEWRGRFQGREFTVFDHMMIYYMLNLDQSADGAIIKGAMIKHSQEEVNPPALLIVRNLTRSRSPTSVPSSSPISEPWQ